MPRLRNTINDYDLNIFNKLRSKYFFLRTQNGML